MRRPLFLATWAAGAVVAAVVTGAGLVAPDATPARPAPTLPLTASPARDELAAALRRGDWGAALQRLEPATGGSEPASAEARLLLGLAAHGLGRHADAERWLDGARLTRLGLHDLGDWRLFLFADAAASRGHGPAAIAALDELLTRLPDSPLRARALLKAAELAAAAGQDRDVLARVDAARGAALVDESAVRLEALAWEAALRLGDRPAQAEAARRLLTLAPLEASRLQVARAFPGGAWTAALAPAELERRAESLLAIDLAPSAGETLDAVPATARGARWHTLKARALVAEHRAAEACELLAGVVPEDSAERLLVDWTHAQAAAAAATPVRGRANPPAAVRERYRKQEDELLQRAAARAAADPAIGRLALRALYANQEAEERTEEAIATLQRLLALDPADTTGARHLWERGWREYRSRNFTGAVGWWTQLHSLHPKSAHGRSARYWTARAFAALGETTRAQALFREVAAAIPADFYARQAALRVATPGGTDRDDEVLQSEPWPDDTRLARARLLTDLGLDALAVAELDLLDGRAEPRSATALRGVVLARQGERRESLRLLRRAFPKLGTAFQAEAPSEAIALFYPTDFAEAIRRSAAAQRLPAPLVFAVIHQESAFDPRATSRSGARGLMQVMPATGRELARQLGIPFSTTRLYDPETSLRLGTTYLRQMLSTFDGNVELALAGYNGGPNRIRQLWRRAGPAPELDSFLEGLSVEESRNYVKRILVLSDGYRRQHPTLG